MKKAHKNILYIDDEENNIIVFKNAFFRHYNIYTALSGEEGLDILNNETIHLLITDQKMPGMTGVDVLEKAVQSHPDTIRMILTAYSDIEVIIKAVNTCGIYQYLLKPWDSRELKIIIDNALERHRLEQQNKQLVADLQAANEQLEEKVKQRTAELNERNAELNQTNAVKDKLFSIISHDLRTPLASMNVFLDVLMNVNAGKASPELIKPYHQKMQNYMRQVMDLLDNLLNWSLTQIGDKQANLAEADLLALVQDNIELAMLSAHQKNITIKTQLSSPNTLVMADHDMLNLVLRNLLSNAVKFTNPDGQITVICDLTDQEALIRVIDNGTGIAAHDLAALFEAKEHFSKRGTAEEKGAGIGLKLCREFMLMQAGNLKVRSSLGQGSEFTIHIPRAAHNQAG